MGITATDQSGLSDTTTYYFKVDSIEYSITTGVSPTYQDIADLIDTALNSAGFGAKIVPASGGEDGEDIRVYNDAVRGSGSTCLLEQGDTVPDLFTNLNFWSRFRKDPVLGFVSEGPKCYEIKNFYERLVIETYHPTGAGWENTFITLYDDSTLPQVIATADSGHPDPNMIEFAYLDYTGGLNAGIYYIEVKKGPGGSSLFTGYYAIRVLTPAIEESVGSGPILSVAEPDPYEPDDAVGGDGKPINPKNIVLDIPLSRKLSSDTDIDWHKLILHGISGGTTLAGESDTSVTSL